MYVKYLLLLLLEFISFLCDLASSDVYTYVFVFVFELRFSNLGIIRLIALLLSQNEQKNNVLL